MCLCGQTHLRLSASAGVATHARGGRPDHGTAARLRSPRLPAACLRLRRQDRVPRRRPHRLSHWSPCSVADRWSLDASRSGICTDRSCLQRSAHGRREVRSCGGRTTAGAQGSDLGAMLLASGLRSWRSRSRIGPEASFRTNPTASTRLRPIPNAKCNPPSYLRATGGRRSRTDVCIMNIHAPSELSAPTPRYSVGTLGSHGRGAP